ncbi:MAG: family N-acetyltransferase, partial [Mucilaginibacter sp.]|nr:family N-acetyltransferase [Mucilaginibacter sp.]
MRVIMNDVYFNNKGFLISTDRNLLDIGMIYKYLNEDSYWAQGIPLEILKKGIENSLCFGVYHYD